jgi:hypothetical protein
MPSLPLLPSLLSLPSVRLSLVALALAGCGNAGPGGVDERTGSTASAEITPTPDLFANDEAAYDYFLGKGLTNFQSAGIVGNLDQESGVDPTSVQQGGPGRGIAQWSVGGRWDTDANDNVLWYTTQQGQSSTSLTLQLDFIWYELTTFSGYGLAALQASTNVTDATVAFETDFEGCGTCDQSTRISYAEGVLSAYGAADYAATFVSQSFPYATTTMMMTEGQVIPSYIELKNTGTKSWDSNTRIGTTQPRDRVSTFADSTWVSTDRPAQVTGTVAPGGTYKFTFDLAASTPGTYDEYFGVVEDGVAWFSDPGQGGPPDTQLEVKITVLAKSGSDAGVGADDAGKHPDDAGEHGDAGEPKDDAGSMGSTSPSDDSGVVLEGTDAGDGGTGNGSSSSGSSGGGCSVGGSPGTGSPWGGAAFTLLAIAASASRTRRRRA